MEKKENYLNSLLHLLQEIAVMEKNTEKIFSKLRRLANSPELAKAMHHEQTGIFDHINRIKLIRNEIAENKKVGTVSTSFKLPVKWSKGSERDLYILAKAQELIVQKIAWYKVAHSIAISLKLEAYSNLFDQTITDNEATCTWLNRIMHRIINGDMILPESNIQMGKLN